VTETAFTALHRYETLSHRRSVASEHRHSAVMTQRMLATRRKFSYQHRTSYSVSL